jgi:hypothetical protein
MPSEKEIQFGTEIVESYAGKHMVIFDVEPGGEFTAAYVQVNPGGEELLTTSGGGDSSEIDQVLGVWPLARVIAALNRYCPVTTRYKKVLDQAAKKAPVKISI